MTGKTGISIIHTGDLHGSLDAAMAERLSELKNGTSLHLNCGDSVKSGNLAIPLRTEKAWGHLSRAGCDAGVPGNREIHVIPAGLRAKLKGCTFPLVCSNIMSKNGDHPFPKSVVLEVAGIRVGLVGTMVPFVTIHMKMQAASLYIWESAIEPAVEEGERLRPEVDCLIALTHIGLRRDVELAQQFPHFDMILGGHSHNRMDEPQWVGKVPILHSGAHGHKFGLYTWEPGQGLTSAGWHPLKTTG